jgi:lysine 6-dehydrogenase
MTQALWSSAMDAEIDVVLDFLPPQCIPPCSGGCDSDAAFILSTPTTHMTFSTSISAAKEKGISILPECGLDPGIDLITLQLLPHGFRCGAFKLNSYCGGIPEEGGLRQPPQLQNQLEYSMPC